MSEEEKEAIKVLKEMQEKCKYKTYIENEERSEWQREYKAVDTILNYIDKQEKIIDSLAQWVSNLSPMVDKQAVKDIIYKEIENV